MSQYDVSKFFIDTNAVSATPYSILMSSMKPSPTGQEPLTICLQCGAAVYRDYWRDHENMHNAIREIRNMIGVLMADQNVSRPWLNLG